MIMGEVLMPEFMCSIPIGFLWGHWTISLVSGLFLHSQAFEEKFEQKQKIYEIKQV